MQTEDYSKDYSEQNLFAKLGQFALSAGRELVEKVCTLYHTLQDSDTPVWAKGVIIGALGYFISPIDAIPDVIPFAGFADDLGALATAIAVVAAHIKDHHVQQAEAMIQQWFGKKE